MSNYSALLTSPSYFQMTTLELINYEQSRSSVSADDAMWECAFETIQRWSFKRGKTQNKSSLEIGTVKPHRHSDNDSVRPKQKPFSSQATIDPVNY